MKKLFVIFFVFISSSGFTQNIWEPINFPDTVSPICINAENEDILFVSANNNNFRGLFRSYDDGVIWEYLQVSPNHQSTISTIKYDQNGVLFIESGYGIYKSINNGDTFVLVCPTQGNISKINISPQNEIYAVGWAGILRSQDEGNTWDTLYDAENSQYFRDIAFGLNGEIYAVGGNFIPFGDGFYRSLDNGISWESTGPIGDHIQSVQVNANGVILVGGTSLGIIMQSNDLGLTWTIIADICADVMESYSDQKLIAGRKINGESGCWFSEDWGLTWVDLVDQVINPRIDHVSVSPSNTVYIQSIYSSSFDNQLFKSINPILSTNSKSFNNFDIFPIPTGDVIFVNTSPDLNFNNYTIYSQNGIKIMAGTIINKTIDISLLKTGFYILELRNGSKITIKKIIKK